MSAQIHRYKVRLRARSESAAVDSVAVFVQAPSNDVALEQAATILKSPTRWIPESVEKATGRNIR